MSYRPHTYEEWNYLLQDAGDELPREDLLDMLEEMKQDLWDREKEVEDLRQEVLGLEEDLQRLEDQLENLAS